MTVPVHEARDAGRWGGAGFVVGIILSLALLGGMFLTVPFERVWQAVRSADLGLALAAMICASLILWLRGLRWSLLFSPLDRGSVGLMSRLTTYGLALNAVLPGKFGELARIGLAGRRLGLRSRHVLATVVAERLLDGLALLSLLALAFLSLPSFRDVGSVEVLSYHVESSTLYSVTRSVTVACLLLLAGVLFVSLPRVQRWGEARADLGGAINGRLTNLIATTIRSLGHGFGRLRSLRTVIALGALSLIVWSFQATCNWIAALAVPGIELSFLQALVVTTFSIAAASLPSVPGGWGLFEAGVLLALIASGVSVSPEVALGYAFVTHLCQYLPNPLIALVLVVMERGRILA